MRLRKIDIRGDRTNDGDSGDGIREFLGCYIDIAGMSLDEGFGTGFK
ncbi:MAG: hypothetical protein P8J87_00260 [Verrucomicrobiales bacterium]|nr:hypothetical protein [Verrucomicrobiales bacterium]